jgi:peptidoglycan/LPS O-acetylase OafA/YrhL
LLDFNINHISLKNIYITRFLAAILVVVYHFGLRVEPFKKGILHAVTSNGNEAVNYFFFLSGFIMMVAYYKPDGSNGVISKIRYWINRFARIYPVYFLSLILVALFYWLIDPSLFTTFGLRFPLELTLLQSWIGKTSLNFPGWSLSVELFFYLSFPYMIFWIARTRTLSLAFAGLLIYFFSQFVYAYLILRFGANVSSRLAINYFPVSNFSTFTLGCFIGVILVRYKTWILGNVIVVKFAGYLTAVLLFLGIVYLVDFDKFHHNGLLAPVYGFLLLASAPETKISKWLGNPFFVFLGDISYGIYILQYPIWLYYRYFFKISDEFSTPQFYSYLGFLICISAIVYHYYERLMQLKIRNWLKT